MMKLQSLAVLGALAVLAGCGSDDRAAIKTVTVEAKSTTAANETTTAEKTADGTQDEFDRSLYALALSKNYESAARFCVRKIGARIGVEEPPSPELRRKKDLIVMNVKAAAREVPDLEVNGQPLPDFILKVADTLRGGQCDTATAAKLEDIAEGMAGSA